MFSLDYYKAKQKLLLLCLNDYDNALLETEMLGIFLLIVHLMTHSGNVGG